MNLYIDQTDAINAMGFTVSEYVRDLIDNTFRTPLSQSEKQAIENLLHCATEDFFERNNPKACVTYMRKNGFNTPLNTIVEYGKHYLEEHPYTA